MTYFPQIKKVFVVSQEEERKQAFVLHKHVAEEKYGHAFAPCAHGGKIHGLPVNDLASMGISLIIVCCQNKNCDAHIELHMSDGSCIGEGACGFSFSNSSEYRCGVKPNLMVRDIANLLPPHRTIQ